jgi:iron complex transport system ATP-binding protein
MSVLTIRDLSVKAWGAQLLSHVSVEVKAGEILAIIGPNGAGKTTLMNAILDAYDPHSDQANQRQLSGEIMACGIPSNNSSNISCGHSSHWQSQTRARHMALLPQLSLLNFPFSVEEVVQLSRIPHNTGTVIDKAIINDALKALDIHHLKYRLYTQLSGGEKQRVQLARVMAQIWRSEDAEQRLLLLDEPTSSLDLGHQQQLMAAIRNFANERVATVMVVHDINLAIRHADSLLALLCGEAIAQGKPEEIVNAALIKTLYQLDVDIILHSKTGKPIISY